MKTRTQRTSRFAKQLASAVIAFAIFTPFHFVSAASLPDTFISMAKKSNLPLSKQVFCAADENGYIAGYNDSDDIQVIPASVSKLYAFDFALNTLGEDFRYVTTFTLRDRTLYINGGNDPHLVSENLAKVIKEITNGSKTKIEKVVIASRFYLNWKKVPNEITSQFKTFAAKNPDLPFANNFSVSYATKNYKGTGTRYELQSAPLPVLMKQMSNWSTNITTDVLFEQAGGSKEFASYMKETYGATESSVKFGTGSGLSDNYTTCGLTLEVIKHLEETAEDLDVAIYNIMSAPRLDPGVLRDTFATIPNTSGLLVKSGTLNYHRNYAGIANTTTGPVYFAVFSGHSALKDAERSKIFAQRFIGELIKNYKLKNISYKPSNDVIGGAVVKEVKK